MATGSESQQNEKFEFINKDVSYSDIAEKLLNDRLLLTALEFHSELLESGKEIRQLKNFFSNPKNFELQTQEFSTQLSRSGSQVTLDSLDLTRYSEDGAGTDERVAILEFELRKAKETINALRNNLTVATEIDITAPNASKDNMRNTNASGIKPHEQRALNFLINEYLLIHGYKLTSITFADENPNQDFDDWDDVGLNISKPPELLSLYRDGLKQTGCNSSHISSQTDEDENEELIKEMNRIIQTLEAKIHTLQSENSEILKLHDAMKELMLHQSCTDNQARVNSVISSQEQDYTHSPERFEMVDGNSDRNSASIILEDNISNNSSNTNEWMNVSIGNKESQSQIKNETDAEADISSIFKKCPFTKEVFVACYIDTPSIVDQETHQILSKTVVDEDYVHLTSNALLTIIPSVILNKREDIIPLLLTTIHLNPKASERDQLLQQFFNLKKKPSEAERKVIVGGLLAIAKCSGESVIENEILPQCWLQLTHKYVERRLLVAEACIALIPLISEPIRNSLCLSIIQQMLDDKDDVVRETVIKAFSILTVLCCDKDKYIQCEQLAVSTLNDSSNSLVNLSAQILFPVLGKWALQEGLLCNSLFKKLLNILNNNVKSFDSLKVSQFSDKILRIINIVENLLPFLLMSVARHQNILTNIEKDVSMELRSDFKNVCTSLTNPEIFSTDGVNCGMVVHEFDKYIKDNPNVSWPEMDWIVDIMLPDLLNNLQYIESSQQQVLQSFINLFSHFCIIFGENFAVSKMRPLVQSKMRNLEQAMTSFNQFSPNLNILPVYLTILTYTKGHEEMANLLRTFVCALPLCGTPLDCLEVTLRRLCESGMQEMVVQCLWSGVVHQRPLVRAASATLFGEIVGICDRDLLRTKVTAALVTLAADNDMLVRTAAIPALGSLITDCSIIDIHDKVYMQLQNFLSDDNLKENHGLLRQLIVTLGKIVNSCSVSFRNDVVLPQLASFSMLLPQIKNPRKTDLVLAMLNAFTNIIYTPLNDQITSKLLLPGLRNLEAVIMENENLHCHWETITSLMKECENKIDFAIPESPIISPTNKTSHNVNQSVEEMRQKVSKIFHTPLPKPNNLPNLQGFFKKK
ncbi:unnamed protein product [Phaedon cochleariae]|uniref:LisH domain-containing protein n=1 Tax=Phaedon cochleariae TaxID=80249 RepID=A0A9P0DUK0_PHACE|nr:unnamed protein product [Phaedon cochleariae]